MTRAGMKSQSTRQVRSLLATFAMTISLGAIAGTTVAQPAASRTELVSPNLGPIQSYSMGHLNGRLFFFNGISGMGLHGFAQGRESFPQNVFNEEIIMYDPATDTRYASGIDHLPTDLQLLLVVTNAAAVQYDEHLFIHGGYGHVPDGRRMATHGFVLDVDLSQIEAALLNGQPAPPAAFNILHSPESRVAGASIVKLGRYYALIGGSNFVGDYGFAPTFSSTYSKQVHIFDSELSHTEPVKTYFHAQLRRRDLNASPITLGSGGMKRHGFAIHAGVFKPNEGFNVWEHPLVFDEADGTMWIERDFVQYMNQYHGPHASLHSETNGANYFVTYGGLSSSNWDAENKRFLPNPIIPWVTDISLLVMNDDHFKAETVIGQAEKPITNGELVVADHIATNAVGQILWDELPPGESLIGHIYGGIEAAFPANSAPTIASPNVYAAYITVDEIRLRASSVIPGQNATLTVTGADAGETIQFAYSVRGRGRTYVPSLDLRMDLKAPLEDLGAVVADEYGEATLTMPIPSDAPLGLVLGVQAVGGSTPDVRKSNAILVTIGE